METIESLKEERDDLRRQLVTYRDAEIKNPLARSESIAFQWMNRALNAESKVADLHRKVEELKPIAQRSGCLLADVEKLRAENTMLKAQNDSLDRELARRDAENAKLRNKLTTYEK